MNCVVVREAVPDEIPQVIALFETVFSETFSVPVPTFNDVIKGERLFVALLDDNVIGMASVWEPDRYIHFLFVDPKYRRKKVGNTLVIHLSEIYGFPLTLKCLISNKPGLAFYRATGWQGIETGTSEDGEYVLMCYSG